MALISIEKCPLCQGSNFQPYLTCKDHTTSGENFKLIKCTTCGFVLTSPRPDDNTIGHYYESANYISHTSQSSSLFGGLYLLARKFTLSWKIKTISKIKVPDKILDYGCGTGDFLRQCISEGWSGYGVEPSEAAHTKARENTKLNIYKDLSQLSGTKFEVITLWHVLEHVPDLEEKLIQFRSLMEKDGLLFIAVPNHSSYDAKIYQEQWAAYDVPRHLWHFTQESMQALAKKTGYTIREIKPMRLDAFYISLLSEKYLNKSNSLFGMMHAFVMGLKSNLYARRNKNYSSLIYILQ